MGLRVLVSGFETFSHHKTNPSRELILKLNQQRFDFELAGIVLPVTFAESFKTLEAKVVEFKPHLIVAFGLAEKRDKISLEARAKNIISTKIPDNNGVEIVDEKIFPSKEDFLYSQFDLKKICQILNEPNLEISQDAGSYVCNFLYYHLLNREAEWNTKSLFVHLPYEVPNLSYLEFAHKLLEQLVE